jgi:uncharacterized protein YciI
MPGMKIRTLLAVLVLGTTALGQPAGPAGAPGRAEGYFLVLLRRAPDWKPLPPAEQDRLQASHMENMRRMADAGTMVAAGPMADNPTTISGIFVFRAASLAEAQRIADQDPTIIARRNRAEVYHWRGPPGIGDAYFQWKKAHPAEDDVMSTHAFCLISRVPSASTAADAAENSAFIDSLRARGLLAAAGSIEGDPVFIELVIFKTASVKEAKQALGDDGPIRSGRLAVEWHHWWTADLVLPW